MVNAQLIAEEGSLGNQVWGALLGERACLASSLEGVLQETLGVAFLAAST